MDKQKILNQFKRDTQSWKIVNYMLTFGSIKNHEIHSKCGATCHTARLTEIRQTLPRVGYELPQPERVGITRTFIYRIKTLNNVTEA